MTGNRGKLIAEIHGAKHQRNVRVFLMNLTRCFNSVHNGHREVQQYHIRSKLARLLNGLLSFSASPHTVPTLVLPKQ
jgi:hypothetical protein